MRQSRIMSMVEAATNVVASATVSPLQSQNLQIGVASRW